MIFLPTILLKITVGVKVLDLNDKKIKKYSHNMNQFFQMISKDLEKDQVLKRLSK